MWSYGVVVLRILLGRVPDVFITWVVREGANEDTVMRAVQVRMMRLELIRGVVSLSLESCRSRTHCLPWVARADVAERVGGGERPPRGPVALPQHPA